MKKTMRALCLALALLLAFCVAGCKKNDDNREINVAAGFDRYDLDAPLAQTVGGIGAQIDTDNFMPYNALTPDEEAMLEGRIEDMNLQFTRIKFFPEFFERGNDNSDPDSFDYSSPDVDFESVEMQALYKILDICERHNVRVDLSWYGCYAWFDSADGKYDGTWLGWTNEELGRNDSWVTGPKKTEDFDGYAEYAENIAVMLDYLINTKKYTCVYGFSVIAEMFMIGEKDPATGKVVGKLSWDGYSECVAVVDAKLKREGLRDKVVFFGHSNAGNVPKNFNDEQQSVKEYFDIPGTGNYNWDINDNIEAALNYFDKMVGYSEGMGKKGYYVSEFCQGKHFLDAVNKTDIDDYGAGMYIARFSIAALSEGVTFLNHYILGDTMFGNYVHTMGLWKYRDENWEAHPEYYFYGLITKYSDIGATVYPVVKAKGDDYHDIISVAMKLPDGSWSYFISNATNSAAKIAIVNEDGPDKFNAYRITEAAIPEDRAVTLPAAYAEIDSSAGVAYVNLPANSFTVLSNKR